MLLTEKDLQTRRDFEKYANEFFEGRVPFGSWVEHTLSWWDKIQNRKNCLFLSYEEVRTDLRATIHKLTKFLSRSLSAEDISRVCQKCCLTKLPWNGDGGNNKKDEFLDSINDGEMNEWKEYFTVSQSEQFDELLKPKLTESGICSKFSF
uniref:Estrogen sulfotransferase-like n=1 Tax=Saccoglossus kowalevskii TaxID=10224 RepID=A0ABM0MPY2_SACKO|nr:PREDICTED: estrogen sulfotransferase-like [Saccoglossus kowalevskii]